MAKKEKRGGNLSNEEVEKEVSRRSDPDSKTHPYRGLQDTGDQTVRHLGSEVQREDGIASADQGSEGDSGRSGGGGSQE